MPSRRASRRTSRWGEGAGVGLGGLGGRRCDFCNHLGPTTTNHLAAVRSFSTPPSYVDKAYAKAGTELNLVVRGKPMKAVVTKMPFVTTTYYKG